jgi:hypothetical protein
MTHGFNGTQVPLEALVSHLLSEQRSHIRLEEQHLLVLTHIRHDLSSLPERIVVSQRSQPSALWKEFAPIKDLLHTLLPVLRTALGLAIVLGLFFGRVSWTDLTTVARTLGVQ